MFANEHLTGGRYGKLLPTSMKDKIAVAKENYACHHGNMTACGDE
jgi:hypothetical protein